MGQGSRYPVGGSIGIKTGEFTTKVFGQCRRPDLDEYIHRPAYVLRKLGESDGIVLRRFVTDLNLSFEPAITTSLKVAMKSVKKGLQHRKCY